MKPRPQPITDEMRVAAARSYVEDTLRDSPFVRTVARMPADALLRDVRREADRQGLTLDELLFDPCT